MTNNREEQIYKAADKATYQTPPQYSELVHKSRKAMCAYEVGFIDGCVWADSHPHWIPVEEELPEKEEDNPSLSVNVIVTDGNSVFESYYSFNTHIWAGTDIYGTITHWMPLPQPPRKEEE